MHDNCLLVVLLDIEFFLFSLLYSFNNFFKNYVNFFFVIFIVFY